VEFKKTRVKQIITAIKTVRESFKQLEEEQQYNIKDFYMMSINERLSMIEGYLQSLEHEQPEELDKLQADYNNLLSRYRGLQQRHHNIVENQEAKEECQEQTRVSLFDRGELNSIAVALESFNNEYKGIIATEDYQRLMKKIRKEEEIQKAKQQELLQEAR